MRISRTFPRVRNRLFGLYALPVFVLPTNLAAQTISAGIDDYRTSLTNYLESSALLAARFDTAERRTTDISGQLGNTYERARMIAYESANSAAWLVDLNGSLAHNIAPLNRLPVRLTQIRSDQSDINDSFVVVQALPTRVEQAIYRASVEAIATNGRLATAADQVAEEEFVAQLIRAGYPARQARFEVGRANLEFSISSYDVNAVPAEHRAAFERNRNTALNELRGMTANSPGADRISRVGGEGAILASGSGVPETVFKDLPGVRTVECFTELAIDTTWEAIQNSSQMNLHTSGLMAPGAPSGGGNQYSTDWINKQAKRKREKAKELKEKLDQCIEQLHKDIRELKEMKNSGGPGGIDRGGDGPRDARPDRSPSNDGPKHDSGPKDKGPKDSGPKDRGPRDNGPRDRGPRERPGSGGGGSGPGEVGC